MSSEEKRSAAEKGYSHALYEIPFLPAIERQEYQTGPVHEGLAALKKSMKDSDFDKYINTLDRITYDGSRLFMITRFEMYRTLLTTIFHKAICDAFHVDDFRVFSNIGGYDFYYET